MIVILDTDQRDAMYRFIITDLEGVGDIVTFMKANKVEEAQQLRNRFEQDAWLLDELGWSAVGVHECYEVEFPDEDTILGRFRREAGAIVDKSGEEEPDFSDQALIDALYVFRLCDGVFGGSEADATSS
jgi:hypothetical protein